MFACDIHERLMRICESSDWVPAIVPNITDRQGYHDDCWDVVDLLQTPYANGEDGGSWLLGRSHDLSEAIAMAERKCGIRK